MYQARIAALERAVALRRPLPGFVFHTVRGSQYASEKHRALLDRYGFVGSTSRRGEPYDTPKAESFMKTPKLETVYLTEYDTYEDVATDLPRFIDDVYNERRLHSAWAISAPSGWRNATPAPLSNRRLILSDDWGALQQAVTVRVWLIFGRPLMRKVFERLSM